MKIKPNGFDSRYSPTPHHQIIGTIKKIPNYLKTIFYQDVMLHFLLIDDTLDPTPLQDEMALEAIDSISIDDAHRSVHFILMEFLENSTVLMSLHRMKHISLVINKQQIYQYFL